MRTSQQASEAAPDDRLLILVRGIRDQYGNPIDDGVLAAAGDAGEGVYFERERRRTGRTGKLVEDGGEG